MNMLTTTLTIREIFDLAKAAQLIPHDAKLADCQPSDEDADTAYCIVGEPAGITIKDDDGTPRKYRHGAYLEEYPDEGTYPLGDEIPAPEASKEGE